MNNHSTQLALGIDIGTTKVAVAIVDPHTRRAIATSSIPHEGDLPVPIRGRSEQSVPKILGALDRCVAEIPLDLRDCVRSIGVTGQMHGVVMWNTDSGEVSHLVTWQDQRCLENNFLSELRTATGDTTAQSGYGTSTLAWLAATEPNTLSRFSSAATIHDYLVARISGTLTAITDPSDGASFGFFDLASRAWREDYISKANIPRHILPQIRSAGEHVGHLSTEYSARWELPPGIPIGNALGDNQASLYGSLTQPATQVALTIGTGAQLSVVVPTLPSDYAASSARFEFRPYVGESYIAVVASLTGGRALAALGKALESFIGALGIENPPAMDAIQTTMHTLGLERATTDLRAHASLSGERYDLSLRGSFTNLSFDNFTIGDMTAALCHGLVTSLRDSLPAELLRARTEIVGSGNAIRRSLLMQRVIRESFGCDVKLQEGAETTACGAALVAADAEG
jgi:sedoheptulokinase